MRQTVDFDCNLISIFYTQNYAPNRTILVLFFKNLQLLRGAHPPSDTPLVAQVRRSALRAI